jgi:hypothetical protein
MLWPAVSRLERYPEMEVGSGFRAVVYCACPDRDIPCSVLLQTAPARQLRRVERHASIRGQAGALGRARPEGQRTKG